MNSFILTWLVTAVSLIIISRLDVGIGVATFGKALIVALVIGLINAILGPVLGAVGIGTSDILSLSIVALVINAGLLWAVARMVPGFGLRNGFWSALLGAILLAVINAVLLWVLGQAGLA